MFARNNEGKLDYKKIIIESGLYLVLFCMLIAIIIKEPTFLSLRNFKNILTQSSVRTIIALGVAGLIVTQGTDLSAGRQVGLSAVKSVPCVTISPATPSAIIVLTDDCVRMFLKFLILKKVGSFIIIAISIQNNTRYSPLSIIIFL